MHKVFQALVAKHGKNIWNVQMALFAGRRSTDRTFLLLQNLMCAKHLPNYMGTSSVFAVTLIDRTARRLGMNNPEQRRALTGTLLLIVWAAAVLFEWPPKPESSASMFNNLACMMPQMCMPCSYIASLLVPNKHEHKTLLFDIK